MIWPSVISWAMPRPATIRMSVATIGWIPMTATRTPFQSPQSMESPSAAATATSTVPTLFWSCSMADQQAGDGAGDRRDRADREVDAAGRDDERHAERDEHQRRAEADDVDQAAVEVAAAHLDEKNPGEKKRFVTRSAAIESSGQTRRCLSTSCGCTARDRLHQRRRP